MHGVCFYSRPYNGIGINFRTIKGRGFAHVISGSTLQVKSSDLSRHKLRLKGKLSQINLFLGLIRSKRKRSDRSPGSKRALPGYPSVSRSFDIGMSAISATMSFRRRNANKRCCSHLMLINFPPTGFFPATPIFFPLYCHAAVSRPDYKADLIEITSWERF